MTNYYVASTGSNTSPYNTWAKASTTFASAVSAATAAGDVIYVDQGLTDTLSASITYTFANHVSVICSNDTAHEPPQVLSEMGEGSYIGHSSSAYSITLAGGYKVFFYGITFRASSTANILVNWTDTGHFEFDYCYFWLGSGSSALLNFGYTTSASINNYTKISNSIFKFGHASQKISFVGKNDLVNCSVSASGTAPTTLFYPSSTSIGGSINSCIACDFSYATGTLVGSFANSPASFVFENCRLGSGVTVFATQTPANKSSAIAWLYNCSASNQHYHLAHYDAFGSTVIDTGIYANDGAKYDGTNGCSWKIVTTANCSYYTPYVSPWIDCYHSNTSAITPSLEVVCSGSATPYQDNEVWGEFSYQGTSGYPQAILVNDRKSLLASSADQTTGALGADGWTGENATAWFGKLNPTISITPAEIGHLRARVCVGKPSITIYVDPTLRGRS